MELLNNVNWSTIHPRLELTDCWSDIIPAVMTGEWKICRKALDTPMLQKDASFVLMPSSQTNTGENLPLTSSIHVGERMRASVKAQHTRSRFSRDLYRCLKALPMVIKYPHKYVNPCWCDQGSPLLILFQIMNQFVNFMQVEYLPVIVPTEKETKIPHEFANRVRNDMAKALSVVCTEHSFLDIKLALAALKLNQPLGSSLVEFARMEKLFHCTLQISFCMRDSFFINPQFWHCFCKK